MSVFVFFIPFLFYLQGLNGTVPAYRDSGDLIASIYTLGIAHPPGYALYVLLGKAFVTLLPFGNIAYRVNVMSAVFAAGTVTLLYKLLSSPTVTGGGRKGTPTTAGNDKFSALAVTLLFAASPAVTALARVAEMYTLSAFLAALIVLCLQSDNPRGPSWAALILGLGLSVHLTLIFLLPLFLIAPARTLTRSTFLYFLLGLCVFLYLPIRAAQDPVVNWGDPSSWRNFWRVITRADYGGLKLHPEESVLAWTPLSIIKQSGYFVETFATNLSIGGIVLGLFGLFSLCRNRDHRAWTLGILVVWIISGPAFFVLSNLPQDADSTSAILQPYLIVPTLLWGYFMVAGGTFLIRPWAPRSVFAVVLLVMLGAKTWAWESFRHDFYAYDYARSLLRTMPQGAVLYDPDDTTHFSIQVLQLVEKRRPDVMLLSFFRTRWGYEQLKKRWPEFLPAVPMRNGPELQNALWNYSAHKRPFFVELPMKFAGQPYKSHGLLYAHDWKPEDSLSRQQSDRLLLSSACRGECLTTGHRDFFTRHVLGYYAAARCNLGLEYANAKEWKKAVALYQDALAIDPELSAAWNNWGIALYEQQDYAGAAKLFKRGLEFDPKNEMLQKNAQLAMSR